MSLQKSDLTPEFLREWYLNQGLSDREIGERFGVLPYHVTQARQKAGIKGLYRGRKTKKLEDGTRFGRLELLERIKRTNGSIIFRLKCDCGNIVNRHRSCVVSGATRSCGCLHKETMHKIFWQGHGDVSGSLWRRINSSAKLRGIAVTVTIEDLWAQFLKQERRCALSGQPLTCGTRGDASLDRINSSLPYEEGNIQWVHKTVNIMKNKFGQNVFLGWCDKISAYHASLSRKAA